MPFTTETAREAGRKGNREGKAQGGRASKAGRVEAKSEIKKITSAENGKKGGRPKGTFNDNVSDCTCGLDTHPTSCPVGQRLYRRERRAQGKDKNKPKGD